MKTAEEIARNWSVFFTNEGEENNDVIEAMKEYAKSAIEEDRKNIANYHASVTRLVKIEDGTIVTGFPHVDKDSIINAPMIELK